MFWNAPFRRHLTRNGEVFFTSSTMFPSQSCELTTALCLCCRKSLLPQLVTFSWQKALPPHQQPYWSRMSTLQQTQTRTDRTSPQHSPGSPRCSVRVSDKSETPPPPPSPPPHLYTSLSLFLRWAEWLLLGQCPAVVVLYGSLYLWSDSGF